MKSQAELRIRQALSRQLALGHDGDTLIVPEMGLCQNQARIDIAVVNGELHGWEIKTASDTLYRLPSQERAYSAVFDKIWLAVATHHVHAATRLVPPWWGVVAIGDLQAGVSFDPVRSAGDNPAVNLLNVVQLLWRAELLDELDLLGLARGLERAPKRDLWKELAGAAGTSTTHDHLRARVRTRLKNRPGWRPR